MFSVLWKSFQGASSSTQWTKPSLFLSEGLEKSIAREEFADLLAELLRRGRSVRFRVSGSSMWPILRDGDIATLQRYEHHPFEAGAIVAYRSPRHQGIVIHRVIGVSASGYLIKGDNRIDTDGFIARENILGYIQQIERNGTIVRFGIDRFHGSISRFSCRGRIIPLKVQRLVHRFASIARTIAM